MSMDVDFEQLLADQAEEYSNAPDYNNWMPPDNEYLVLVTKVDYGPTGADAHEEKAVPWVRLTCQIVEKDSDLNEKKFSIFYSGKAYGIMRQAARYFTSDSGVEKSPLLAVKALVNEAPGKVLLVQVATTKRKGSDRAYTNGTIVQVKDDVNVAPAEQAAPQNGNEQVGTAQPQEGN
jgi:hypothetical protein